MFLQQRVVWLRLEELSQRPDLDPLLNLLDFQGPADLTAWLAALS